MAPRCGYLLWISEQLLDNLRNLPLPEIEYPSSLWYSRHGEPLPWHLPLGLLYDLDRSAHPSDPPLPWTIQVHTRGYPIDRLLPPPCDDLLYAHHMSMMKESDVLRHGSANKVMRLSKEDQTSLFNSLRQGDMEGFWRVNGQLVGLGDPRNIPVRIYLPHQASPYQCLIPAVSKEGRFFPFHSSPLSPSLPSLILCLSQSLGETTCLSHLLQELPSQWVSREEDGSISPTVQVLLHGVPLPRDIPLTWASEALAYADNFLYLILSSSS
ncbi:MAG: autophagy-related protein 5 [Piptocephalis tieghemiana]|nr:MAG: autophagy-related protein 5 [Piptocephalis tieghemiana]